MPLNISIYRSCSWCDTRIRSSGVKKVKMYGLESEYDDLIKDHNPTGKLVKYDLCGECARELLKAQNQTARKCMLRQDH